MCKLIILFKKDLKLILSNKKALLSSFIFPLFIFIFLLLLFYFKTNTDNLNKTNNFNIILDNAFESSYLHFPDYFNIIYSNNSSIDNYIIKNKGDIGVKLNKNNIIFIANQNINKNILETTCLLIFNIIKTNKINQTNKTNKANKIINTFTELKVLNINSTYYINKNKNIFILTIYYAIILLIIRINNPNVSILTVSEIEKKTIIILKTSPIPDSLIIIEKYILNTILIIFYIIFFTSIFYTLLLFFNTRAFTIEFKMFLIFLSVSIIFSLIYSIIQIYLGFIAKNSLKSIKTLTVYPATLFIVFSIIFSLFLLSINNYNLKILSKLNFLNFIPLLNLYFMGNNILIHRQIQDNKIIILIIFENLILFVLFFKLAINKIKSEQFLY